MKSRASQIMIPVDCFEQFHSTLLPEWPLALQPSREGPGTSGENNRGSVRFPLQLKTPQPLFCYTRRTKPGIEYNFPEKTLPKLRRLLRPRAVIHVHVLVDLAPPVAPGKRGWGGWCGHRSRKWSRIPVPSAAASDSRYRTHPACMCRHASRRIGEVLIVQDGFQQFLGPEPTQPERHPLVKSASWQEQGAAGAFPEPGPTKKSGAFEPASEAATQPGCSPPGKEVPRRGYREATERRSSRY